MTDQRRVVKPIDTTTRQSIIGAAVGKWVNVMYLDGPIIDEAHGWLGLCDDSAEIVIEGDGGATFIRIPTLISIEVEP